jgi:hypothetical protein
VLTSSNNDQPTAGEVVDLAIFPAMRGIGEADKLDGLRNLAGAV